MARIVERPMIGRRRTWSGGPAAPEWHPERVPFPGLAGVEVLFRTDKGIVDEAAAAAFMHRTFPGSTTIVWFAGYRCQVTAVDDIVILEDLDADCEPLNDYEDPAADGDRRRDQAA